MKQTLCCALILLAFAQCQKRGSTETAADSITTQSPPTSTGSTALASLRAYKEYINALPLTIASSGDALRAFREKFNESSAERNDSAFSEFLTYQSQVINATDEVFHARPDYNEIMNNLYDPQKEISVDTRQYLETLTANALRVSSTEGEGYLTADPKTIMAYFWEHLSPGGKQYVSQWQTEEYQPFAEDAGITIPIEKLGDRLAYWEAFLKAYPKSMFAPEAEQKKKAYLYFFLTGMDNTPAFGYEDPTVDGEFVAAYHHFVETYPETESSHVIQEYIDLLLKEGNKKTAPVDAFHERFSVF